MTFLFCMKAILAFLSLSLALYVTGKIIVYPFIVLYRWASRSDDVFYLHDDADK